MRRAWPARIALVVALVAGCGGGDDSDPAKDRAAAQEANLKAADFPSGWTAKPYQAQPADEEAATKIPECLGITPPSTRATAEVGSPNFSSGLATQARSVIAFMESEDEVRRDAAAFASDKFAECAREPLTKQVAQAAPEGSTVESLEVTEGDFPTLGERTVAHRVKATIRVQPTFTIPIHIDLVLVAVDRAEVVFTFINPGSPFDEDLARSLATKVVGRL